MKVRVLTSTLAYTKDNRITLEYSSVFAYTRSRRAIGYTRFVKKYVRPYERRNTGTKEALFYISYFY